MNGENEKNRFQNGSQSRKGGGKLTWQVEKRLLLSDACRIIVTGDDHYLCQYDFSFSAPAEYSPGC